MTDEKRTLDGATEVVDERTIGRKYGIRELVYPDPEQTKTLARFLGEAVSAGRCGPVPKTAVLVMLEFLQGVLNRQHITKGPRMTNEEFDVLQTPYYLAARIVSKIVRDREESKKSRGKMYQTTYVNLNQFIELLRSILDPGCYWMRLRSVPDGVIEIMDVLREFALAYPEQKRKGRAM